MVGEPRPEGDAAGEAGSTVVLGLLAPPQAPRDVVEELATELPRALSEHVSDRVSWEVPTLRDTRVPDIEYGEEGDDETIDDVSKWRRHEGWDLAICLPLLRSDGRAVVAEASSQQDAALVSLPALGVVHRRRRAREEIVRLVNEVLGESLGLGRESEGRRDGSGIGHLEPGDDGHLQLVASAGLGKLRLLAGMVRATHPFRVVLGLAYALVAALGTAAFTVLQGSIWELGGALGWPRLSVLMVVSLVTMVVYLIVVHGLWHRMSGRADRGYTALFNATTVITLIIGALTFYGALFAFTLVATGLVIEGGVFGKAIGRTAGLSDYVALSWFVSSLATLGGTLGSGWKRAETCARPPTPTTGSTARRRTMTVRTDATAAQCRRRGRCRDGVAPGKWSKVCSGIAPIRT